MSEPEFEVSIYYELSLSFLGQYLQLSLAAFSIAICSSFTIRKPLEEVNDNRKIPGERCGGSKNCLEGAERDQEE